MLKIFAGIVIRESGAIGFFAIQPLGIVIEDLLLSRYHAIPGNKTKRPPSLTQRVIGYAWVCLWMAWTAPGYLYPIMDKTGSEDNGVVTISVIALIKQKLS